MMKQYDLTADPVPQVALASEPAAQDSAGEKENSDQQA